MVIKNNESYGGGVKVIEGFKAAKEHMERKIEEGERLEDLQGKEQLQRFKLYAKSLTPSFPESKIPTAQV